MNKWIIPLGLVITLFFPGPLFGFPPFSHAGQHSQKDLTSVMEDMNDSLRQLYTDLQKGTLATNEISKNLSDVDSKLGNISKEIARSRDTKIITLFLINFAFPLMGVLIGAFIGYHGVKKQIQSQAKANYINTILSFPDYRRSLNFIFGALSEAERVKTHKEKTENKEEIIKSCEEVWFELFFRPDEDKKSQFIGAVEQFQFSKAKEILMDFTIGKSN